jgi:hypothetical protein
VALSLILDHAQKRTALNRDAIRGLFSAGYRNIDGEKVSSWHPILRENCIASPVDFTGMLAPAPLRDEWHTSGAGINARLRKTDFSFPSAADWEEHTQEHAADYYLQSKTTGGVNQSGYTNDVWNKNQGFYVAFFPFKAGPGGADVYVEFGWANEGDPTAAVSLRAFQNGKVEIFVNEELDNDPDTFRVTPGQLPSGHLFFLILPYKRRELLILSSESSGRSHVFEHIDEKADDPTITPATQFWFRVPEGKAHIQIAPIKFPSTGYMLGGPHVFSKAPWVGATLVTPFKPFKDDPGYGVNDVTATLVNPDGTPFTPDGVKEVAWTKCSFTSSGLGTQFVYGAQPIFERELTETSDEPVAIDDYVLGEHEGPDLSVPDSPTDVQLDATIRAPEDLEATLDVPKLRKLSTRPAKLTYNDIAILDGELGPVSSQESTTDGTARARLEIRDVWAQLERYVFRDPFVLDGKNLALALKDICKSAGLEDDDLDIDPIDFDLPAAGSASLGRWNVKIEVGDTAAEWLLRLIDTYYGTAYIAVVPSLTGPKVTIKDTPTHAKETPDIVLWPTWEQAEQALLDEGLTEEEAHKQAYKYVYRSFQKQPLPVRGNDTWVTGVDLRTGEAIQTHYADYGSQDPETPKADRPDNWMGYVAPTRHVDPTMTTRVATDRAATTIFRRVTPLYEIAAWEADFLVKADGVPVWRSGQVKLMPRPDEIADPETYFVRSLSGQFLKTENPADPEEYRDFAFAEFVYVGNLLLPFEEPPTGDDSLERILDLWRADAEEAAAFDLVLNQ